MIETENLSKRYGDLLALDGLSLRVEPGELYAFLGPNAAGKTTTIRLLTGLMRPTSGWSRIAGIDVQEHPLEAKRKIGFIPDVAVFYDKLSALEFMHFIGELFEVDRVRATQRTRQLFEQFALEAYSDQLVERLSHGTKQRLAIASAILHEPEVIIIDEPMVGLDPRHARVVKDELKRQSENGTTVFMSTHLLNVAEELADRIGIIDQGKMVREGTVDELRGMEDGDWNLEEFFLKLTAGEPSDERPPEGGGDP